MDDKVICSFCGEEYSSKLSRCPECGEKNKNVAKGAAAIDDDFLDIYEQPELHDDGDNEDEEENEKAGKASRKASKKDQDKIPVWIKCLILVVAGLAIMIAALFMLYKMGIISIGAKEEQPAASVSLPVDTEDTSTESTPAPKEVVEVPVEEDTQEPTEESPSPFEVPEEPAELLEPDPIEEEPTVECTSITINREDITFSSRGEVYDFNVMTEPSSAAEYVKWSSDDPSVARVSDNGSCTAINGGTAYITATCGDQTATCIVRCSFAVAEYMTMSVEDITMKSAGETARLSVQDADLSKDLEWSSSDESVATVDQSGNVTAIGSGNATIKATQDGKAAECVVRVNIPSITNEEGEEVTLEMNHTDVTLFAVGEAVQMKVKTSDGTELDSSSMTWVSNDENVCTIDATGLVKAVANGNTTVYTTVDGQKVSCIVRVTLK